MFNHLKCPKHQGQAIEYFCPIQKIQNILWCHKCLQENNPKNNENIKKTKDFIAYCEQQQKVIENIENIISNLINGILEKQEKITQAMKQKYLLDAQQIKNLNYCQTNSYLQQLITINDLPKIHMENIEIIKVELLTHFDNFFEQLQLKQCLYIEASDEDIKLSQQYFQQGIEEIGKQNKIVGMNLLKKAIEINPKNIECLLFLGENSFKEQKINESLQYFDQILNFEQTNIKALNGKADVYRAQQKISEAQLLHTTVLNIDPNNLDSKMGIAFCCLYNQPKDLEKGRQIFQQIVDQNPNNSKALFGLGKLQFDLGDSLRLQGKDDLAILQLRKSLNIDPKNVDSLSAMGDCYRLKREFPNAERCFNEALLISPDHERTLERFGDSFRMQKKYQQAIMYYKKVLELNPNNEWANAQIKTCQRGG